MRATRVLVWSLVLGIVAFNTGMDRRGCAWGQAQGAGPVINEFMATNGSVAPLGVGEILDADGDSSDWIEIHNPSDEAVDLGGWFLTDDADDLTLWRFPDGTLLESRGFLVVFASGKDRTSGQLHTNFKLGAEGEYLALVENDGATIADEYGPTYPEQLTGISYGLGQHSGVFISPGSMASYHVPDQGDAGMPWMARDFDDADWPTAATGLGFAPVAELTNTDIGNPAAPGSFFVEDGTYVVLGAGADIGGTRDTFHFVYAPLRGDGELTVHAAGIISANEWSKAGVMIRETLASGSRYAAEMLTLRNGVVFQARTATNGASISEGGNDHPIPLWVRIIRRGDVISGHFSFDGTNWIQQSSETVAMGPDVYIGLCVTSHTPGAPCTAIFDGLMFGSRENNALRDKMLGVNTALWTRVEFDADETNFFDSLLLGMRYDDGFVAFLNGTEVARDNVTGMLQWNSAGDSDRPDALRAESMFFDLSEHRDLLRDGRNVLAVAALNDHAADETFFVSPELTASGDVIVPQYFVAPTPGQANSAGPLDIVATPQPSYPRGLYDDPFLLELSCDTPAATIRYTTDGTTPTHTTGYAYAGPISIDSTTCLRVAAFRPGWMASEVRAHSYILLDQVLEQPKNPPGMPAKWGSTTGDYEMDPDIVDNAAYSPYLKAALVSLPTMSLVVRAEDLFGSDGIYTNWNRSGDAWERPVSVELIYPDGSEGFHVNCGIRIYGGVGRREPKKSFRLQFTRDYGPTKLHYALFGDDAADRFDQIILRANFNDAYTWGGDRSQYIRDEYVRQLQLILGDPSPHGNFVHLYINGVYWGLYNPTERPEMSFSASYFGGDREDWDALNSGRPLGDSTTGTWNAMLSLVRQGVETNAAYQKLQGNNPDGTPNPDYPDYLDIDNYINYMILNFFVGNRDWPGHNWYAAMNRVDTSGWKSYSWDAEWVIGMNSGVNENRTGVNNSLCEPYARLRNNVEFRLAFADRVQEAFSSEGPLYVDPAHPAWDPDHPERNRPAALYAELADGIELAMFGESARWGDVRGGSPYTITQWRNQRDWVLGTYMPQRSANVLGQLKDAGLYPNVEAPVFGVGAAAQHGGYVAWNDPLWIYAPEGTVYYTTDGTDPRLPSWNSADNEIVTLLSEDAPKRVLVPSIANGGDQLGNAPAAFTVTYYKASVSVSSLTIAEQVIANPAQRSGTATEQASVINYFNTGSPGNFDDDRPFPGTQLNADVEDFVILAIGKVLIPAAGEWTFGVNSDDGFGLTLTKDANTYTSSHPSPRGPGDTLTVFDLAEAGQYDLRLVFYERGGGSELELFAARGRYASFSSAHFRLVGDISNGGLQVGEGNVWFTNYFDDSDWTVGAGGVGYEGGTGVYPDYFAIDVTEAMQNQNTSCYIRIPFTVGDAEFSNMILQIRYDDGFVAYLNGAEVARRNFTGDPAWNSNASASNSDDAAVSLATIDISNHVGLLWEGPNLLAIHGLNLATSSSDFLISVSLAAGEISQGAVSPTALEYTEPIPLTGSTHVKARAFDGQWSALNEATFAMGAVAESLRVSEIMYHPIDTGNPDDPNTEYIELTNIGAETVNLNLVEFTSGIDFVFPSIDLAPDEYLLVVRDLDAFDAKYGQGFDIAGRYGGSLDNGGESLELQDVLGQTITEFRYDDNWFDLTDGQGFSLTVKDPVATEPNALGDKAAWRPSAHIGGSPGFSDAGSIPELGAVVINEIMANSASGEPDWIELHNTTGEPIDIGGWFLNDDADDLIKYEIVDGLTLGANGYLVFYEDRHFGDQDDAGSRTPFALSRNGETVYLHSGAEGVLTGYSAEEKFGASETGVSLGRYLKSTGTYNFVALAEPTPGWSNADARTGPIVISEIMYNPLDTSGTEYIELLNISDMAVTLFDSAEVAPWRLTDDPDNPGIEFLFPAAPPVVMAPGEVIVVTRDRVALEAAYGVPEGTQVFVWGNGKLANSSEKVQLSIPGGAEDDGERHWIRLDRVVYSDGRHPDDFASGVDPWPLQADGFGGSLTRIDPTAYGNDPANWQAAAPTPGFIN